MYRLLIVEEEPYCRELESLMNWKAFGFEKVAFATDYADALDKALLLQPHVALIGMTLGERMGWELISQLRGLGLDTLCCLMAGHTDTHDVRRAMRSGCRDILRRPPDSLALKEFLDWVMVSELHANPIRGIKTETDRDPVLGLEYSSLSKITSRIILSVRNEFRNSLSLTVIAKHYNMSSKYIGRIFTKDTGMRFSEYLLAYRMLEAKRLILNTGEKISVIAGMVGYPQLNNFYTHFRQYFGTSPSSLRNTQSIEEEIK